MMGRSIRSGLLVQQQLFKGNELSEKAGEPMAYINTDAILIRSYLDTSAFLWTTIRGSRVAALPYELEEQVDLRCEHKSKLRAALARQTLCLLPSAEE